MVVLKQLFIVFFLCQSFLCAANKHILVLHSYHKGLKWSDDVSKGIEDTLEPLNEYQLTTEYMDTKKNENPSYLEYLYNLLIVKFKHQHYDAVIAVDTDAVEFVLKNKENLFQNIPIIFCGIEDINPGVDIERIKQEKIPLVYESKDIISNIQFLEMMFPFLKYVYIINDSTQDAMKINPIFLEETQKLNAKGIQTKLNIEGNLEEIAYDIAHLPPESVVLLGALQRDNHGNYLPYYMTSNLIRNSSVPVFSIADNMLSREIVGGHLYRGYSNGIIVAQIAIDYLNGKTIDTTKPIYVPSEWIFDYEVMQKYNLDFSKIPPNAIMINLPKTFFDEHRKFVENAFMIFPFVLFSLFFAIMYIYSRHQLAKKLEAKHYWEQVLLNNMNSALFWLDNNGIVKGCNDAFCILTNNVIGEIIYHHVREVFHDCPPVEKIFSFEEMEFSIHQKIYRLKSQQFLDDQGRQSGVICVIMDITVAKQLEIHMQLNIQQSKLAEIGEMFSAIVHQWKVPLVELSAVAHKMYYYDQKKKLTSQNIQKFYDIIMQQTIYMSETIDGFRDFIRPSNEVKIFNLRAILNEVLVLLSDSLKYHNINIYDHYDEEIVLSGYPNELKQVFVNLLNNSKDAIFDARKDNIISTGAIEIDVKRLEKFVNIEIRDNGIGLKNNIQEKLFQPFFSTKEKGDGFGLYMTKLIIESKMNGTISLVPIGKNGVCVTIILPLNKQIEK